MNGSHSALGLGFLLSVGACQCDSETWNASLTPIDDAPLGIHAVEAKRTATIQIGASGAGVDSSTRKNSVSFEIQVTGQSGLREGASLATRSVCRVDDVVWATPFVGDANLESLRAGETRSTTTSRVMPNRFAAGPPTVCEVTMRYQPTRLGPEAPVFEPIDLGAFCWSASSGLTEGRCPAETLGRRPAANAFALTQAHAGWSETNEGHALGLAVAITAGADKDPDAMLIARTACATDGPPRQSVFWILENLGHLEPGETVYSDGLAFTRAGLTEPLERCTIEVGTRFPDASRPVQPIASRCFERGQLTEGGCAGLAPGPVTIRVDVDGQATLVRGAHVEGPFALGTAPSPEAVAPIIASIELADDDGAIVSAASATPQATVVPLIEALRAANIEIAAGDLATDDTAAEP